MLQLVIRYQNSFHEFRLWVFLWLLKKFKIECKTYHLDKTSLGPVRVREKLTKYIINPFTVVSFVYNLSFPLRLSALQRSALVFLFIKGEQNLRRYNSIKLQDLLPSAAMLSRGSCWPFHHIHPSHPPHIAPRRQPSTGQ